MKRLIVASLATLVITRGNSNRLGSITDGTTTKVRITRGDAFWPNTSRVMEIALSRALGDVISLPSAKLRPMMVPPSS